MIETGEEDDVEVLVEAIERGDRERAKRLAYSLVRRSSNPGVLNKLTNYVTRNPDIVFVALGLAAVGIYALAKVLGFFFHSKPREEREVLV